MNEAYIKAVSQYGGDIAFAIFHTPKVVLDLINAFHDITQNAGLSIYTALGALNCDGSEELYYTYGCWLSLNDTERKTDSLNARLDDGITEVEMKGLYSLLADRRRLGVTMKLLRQCGMLLIKRDAPEPYATCLNDTINGNTTPSQSSTAPQRQYIII